MQFGTRLLSRENASPGVSISPYVKLDIEIYGSHLYIRTDDSTLS